MNTAQRLQTLGQQQFAGSDLQWSITQADNQPAQMIEIGV
jgi:hypothetical protein